MAGGPELALAGGQLAASMIPQKSSGSSFGSSYGVGSSYTSGGTTSAFGQQEGQFGSQLLNGIAKDRREYQRMIDAAMGKGEISGVGIPMAQAAIAQARGAASANLGSAETFLARTGAGNSPFGAQLLNSIAAQGNEAAAQAPVDIYKEILGQIPGFINTQVGQGLSALGQAGQLNQNYTQNQNTYTHSTTRDYTKQKSGGFGF